jgi:hypothetical protein
MKLLRCIEYEESLLKGNYYLIHYISNSYAGGDILLLDGKDYYTKHYPEGAGDVTKKVTVGNYIFPVWGLDTQDIVEVYKYDSIDEFNKYILVDRLKR